mgnify:CR=1 FL=1
MRTYYGYEMVMGRKNNLALDERDCLKTPGNSLIWQAERFGTVD